jgi:RimJ/RimL family protein N-acetyltransferase
MLKTDRLHFKMFNSKYEKDLEELFCRNDFVMKTTLKGRGFTREEFKKVLEEAFIQSESDKTGFWCLTSTSEDKLIGVSGLLKCHYLNKASYEFGFILKEDNWGKGLATEIGKFWLKYAKEEMNLTELVATVSPENIASKRVLEKLNMECVDQFTSAERGERLLFAANLVS